MKRTLLLVLVASILLTSASYAYTLQLESKLSKSDIQNLLPGKLFEMDGFSLIKDKGTMFMLIRDKKTRNLEWAVINPASKKLVATGSCPFRAFITMDVSPLGNGALVISRYPTALFHLNLENKSWTKVYKNPGKGEKGLAIISISPISYTESFRAFSLMDMWDAEHFVTGTFITCLMPGTGKMEEVVNVDTLRKLSVKEVFPTPPAGIIFRTDFLRFADSRSFAYILKSKAKNQRKDYKDYLFVFNSPNKVSVLDQIDGRILPLDYQANPMKILYGTFTNGKSQVMFMEGDKKESVLEGKVIVGRIMKDNLLGVGCVEGKTFNIFLGQPATKLKKVLTLTNPYAAGFLADGSRLILANGKEVLTYKIVNK